MVGELSEIVDELLHELGGGLVISGLVRPGRARIEDVTVDGLYRDRHLEAEIGIDAEFNAIEASIERGIQECARDLDRHAVANAIFAARPACVD